MRQIIFVGNPGVGKSTLLNALIKQVHFMSGTKVGAGITLLSQSFEKDGIKYTDTPGLDDISRREEAGEEISAALRAGGDIALTFVVALESGRVHSTDLCMMECVLQALERAGMDMTEKFSVIVNKCEASVLRLLENEDTVDILRAHFSRTKLVGKMLFFPSIPSLVGKDDALLHEATQLQNFVLNECPRVKLQATPELKVQTDNFQSQMAEMERLIHDLTEEIKRMKQERPGALREVLTGAVQGFAMGAGGAFVQSVAFARPVAAAESLGWALLRTKVTKWFYG